MWQASEIRCGGAPPTGGGRSTRGRKDQNAKKKKEGWMLSTEQEGHKCRKSENPKGVPTERLGQERLLRLVLRKKRRAITRSTSESTRPVQNRTRLNELVTPTRVGFVPWELFFRDAGGLRGACPSAAARKRRGGKTQAKCPFQAPDIEEP